MNARSYRVKLNLSPLDFPSMNGLGGSTVIYRSEQPVIVNNKVVLQITKAFVLVDMFDNSKMHQVLAAGSVYEIPVNEIKTRNDVYEFYKDALLSLSEAHQYAKNSCRYCLIDYFPLNLLNIIKER